MSKLIILRGNSGSGKTSLSKMLQKSLGRGTLVVSQDAVRREMLWVRDGPDTSAVPLLISLLEYGRRNCQAVILEGILNSKWYTPVFEEAVRLFGADIHAYYYDLTFEETLRRHQTRAKKIRVRGAGDAPVVHAAGFYGRDSRADNHGGLLA